MPAAIRNPLEWGADQIKHAADYVESTGRAVRGGGSRRKASRPTVRRIDVADVGHALARGLEDFAACRTDIVFLCLIYPVIGLVLARTAFNYDMLPLLFPMASGFALIGPVAAVGLYEMSRRRERGDAVGWADAIGALRTPAFGAVLTLGLGLFLVLLLWLLAAQTIYDATLGPRPPASLTALVTDALTTSAGWQMIAMGTGVGFLLALLVLATSIVSFPLLLDRDVGLVEAVGTSIRASLANPVPVIAWGAVVAAGLVAGSLPFFLGLIVVMPILGHATWHLYRALVARG